MGWWCFGNVLVMFWMVLFWMVSSQFVEHYFPDHRLLCWCAWWCSFVRCMLYLVSCFYSGFCHIGAGRSFRMNKSITRRPFMSHHEKKKRLPLSDRLDWDLTNTRTNHNLCANIRRQKNAFGTIYIYIYINIYIYIYMVFIVSRDHIFQYMLYGEEASGREYATIFLVCMRFCGAEYATCFYTWQSWCLYSF